VNHTLNPNEDFRSTWVQFKGTSGITDVDWYIQKNELWKSFSPIGKTIHPNESYIIKVVYHKKPEIGESNIQLIPMFHGLCCEELTWWNTSWSHRKVITLTGNTSGAQTNYQLLLNITYDSNMQSDFDDLRFSNDTYKIDTWLESKVDNSYALIWVEFPSTPANGIDQTYYMYYGNNGVVSDWNGNETFQLFDDFPGSSLDLTTWTVEKSGTTSIDIGSSICTLNVPDDESCHAAIVSVDTFTNEIAIHAYKKHNDNEYIIIDLGAGPLVGFAMYADSQKSGYQTYYIGYAADYTGNEIYETSAAGTKVAITNSNVEFEAKLSNYYIHEFYYDENDLLTWIVDGTTEASVTDSTFSATAKKLMLWQGAYVNAGRGADQYIDWVFVRKHVSNPPTYTVGSEEYYIDSVHYNATYPYNLTIDSNGNIASNRSIIATDDLNWTAAAVSDDCQMVVAEYNLANITVANFTLYNASLDWLRVTNLTVGAEYNLTNGTTYEHQTADASGEANFTTDLIPGDYQIFGPAITPVITLLSQTPSVLYENSTGYLNISYGISHDITGLNNTSVSFIFRNYDHTLNDANHSIRPPANDKCAIWEYNGRIIRAANRNESLNFENNDTITGGDIYTWSGLDENQTRLSIHPINSTYTIVNINGSVHDLAMEQMWYLDRTSMIESTKTKLAIHKTQDVLIKFWDAEVFKGNYDFIGVGYTDTSLGTLHPSDANPVSFYKLNASYDPLGGVAPLDSPYIVYMGSLNASGWVDHVYSSDGVNYVRGMINNSYVHSIMDTTEIEYLYFTSNTPSAKPYYINITNDASNTNRTFGETNVMWIGDAAPYTAHPYTPNMWFAFIYQNTSFDHKLYAAGASGLWSNSTLNRTYIGAGQFSPTKPYIDHFSYSGVFDYDMDGYYIGNFTIVGGVSTDPDGGTVTHNLTLHYANNLTLVAIINNTFTDADVIGNGVFAEIAFNSTPYLSDTVQYTLKLVATDDEGDTAKTWLGVDFWLAERPPIPGFIFEIFVLMIVFAVGMMMYSFLMIDPDNYTHVLAAFLSGIVHILSGFSVFSGIAFYGDDALLCTDQTGWVAMVFIVLGSIMILYAAVIGLDTAKEVIDELEEST
jgi:hypothetical protein